MRAIRTFRILNFEIQKTCTAHFWGLYPYEFSFSTWKLMLNSILIFPIRFLEGILLKMTGRDEDIWDEGGEFQWKHE